MRYKLNPNRIIRVYLGPVRVRVFLPSLNTIQQLVKLQKSTLHVASFDAFDSTEWIRTTRIQRFRSYNLLHQPLPCGTSWPLNYKRWRFSQNCQLFNALIFIVSSFYNPISAWSTEKVNSFAQPQF